MNSPEQTPESRPARDRRVGTFTFGAVLVICGALMLVSMFFPSLDLTLALQLSPLILVCLGVEVLLAQPLRRENPLRLGGHGALLRPGHRSAGVLRHRLVPGVPPGGRHPLLIRVCEGPGALHRGLTLSSWFSRENPV